MPMNRSNIRNHKVKQRENHRKTEIGNDYPVLRVRRKHSNGEWRVKNESKSLVAQSNRRIYGTHIQEGVREGAYVGTQESKKSAFDLESPKAGKRNDKSISEMIKESNAKHSELLKALVHR